MVDLFGCRTKEIDSTLSLSLPHVPSLWLHLSPTCHLPPTCELLSLACRRTPWLSVLPRLSSLGSNLSDIYLPSPCIQTGPLAPNSGDGGFPEGCAVVNAKGTARGWVRPSQHAQAPAARLRALASSNARKRSKTHRLVRKLSRSSSCGNNDNLSGLRSCWGGAQVVEVVAGGAADGTRALRYRLDASSAEDFSPNDWLHLASEAAGRSRWEGTHTHTIHTHTHTPHTRNTHTHTRNAHTTYTYTHTTYTYTHTQQHTTCVGCGRWEGGQPFACDSAASSQPFVGVLLLLHRSLSVWLRCPTTVVSYVLCSGCRLPAPHSRKK